MCIYFLYLTNEVCIWYFSRNLRYSVYLVYIQGFYSFKNVNETAVFSHIDELSKKTFSHLVLNIELQM